MNKQQENLVEALQSGDLGLVEFFELALDAGLSLQAIGEALDEAEVEVDL